YLPVRESSVKRFDPFAYARLTSINFLATPDETDNDRPVRVTIEARNQEFRFRAIEIQNTLLSLHEPRGGRFIPSSLSLVKDRHMVYRCSCIDQIFITIVMNILNKRLNGS